MSSYAEQVKALAESLGSDGCSKALQIHPVCCAEHDVAYRVGTSVRGVPMTKAQADRRFRDCLQAHSRFRFLSPLAGWRWVAVSLFGRFRPVLKPMRPQSFRGIRSLALARHSRQTQYVLAEAREARRRIIDEELARG